MFCSASALAHCENGRTGQVDEGQDVLAPDSQALPDGGGGQLADLLRALCCRQGTDCNGVQRHVGGKCQCSPSPPRQHGDQIYEVFCRAALALSHHAVFSVFANSLNILQYFFAPLILALPNAAKWGAIDGIQVLLWIYTIYNINAE